MSHDARAVPIFSVTIAARDEEAYIAGAIESALGGRDDVEVVVADDGSVDQTVTVARSFDRVVVVPSDGVGVVDASNTAIRHARGEIIVRLDADDRLMPATLDAYAAALRDPAVMYVVAGDEAVDEAGSTLGWYVPMPTVDSARVEAMVQCPFNNSAIAFRTGLIEEIGGFSGPGLGADYDLWVRLLGTRIPFASLPIAACRRLYRTSGYTARNPHEIRDNGHRIRDGFRRAEAQRLLRFAELRSIGRSLADHDDHTRRLQRYQYVLARLTLLRLQDRDLVGALGALGAGMSLSPWRFVRSCWREARAMTRRRGGHGM